VDISSTGDILAGWPAFCQYHIPVEPGALRWINSVTGDVSPVEWVRCVNDTTSDALRGHMATPYDSQVDFINGILADPHRPGWFYVAVGRRYYPRGKILHINRCGDFEIIYRRQIPASRSDWRILGGPILSAADGARNGDDPILALARDSAGRIYFATPGAVFRVDYSGKVEELGVPEFQLVGDFYMAKNLPDITVILSKHAAQPPDLGDITKSCGWREKKGGVSWVLL